MAAKNLKVYLDHHITRDNLLYKQEATQAEDLTGSNPLKYLHIQDLATQSKARRLRKPDFQRATWAWTPLECVDLLEAVLYEQVVPSVIMWLNPENYQYVLDGGHRISVILAWVRDDWGDKLNADIYAKDRGLERDSRAAAVEVRKLLQQRSIGSYQDYLAADEEYERLKAQNREPELQIDSIQLQHAKTVRRWSAVDMGFPILWVKGSYQNAEDSFLKINKTGRQLSEWETKLVENRSSSFARTIVSIAQVYDAEHCWHMRDDDLFMEPHLKSKIEQILTKVKKINELLFSPVYTTPVNNQQQPLVAVPIAEPEQKPAYVAEILTITEGERGQKPKTKVLIAKDKGAPTRTLVNNGLRLVDNAIDAISHVYGPYTHSLALMPLVYFYNAQGIYVRSLLYGMLYWLNAGSDSDTLTRKKLFTVHRAAFEEIILAHKEAIISRIGRRLGSGAEVTYPTARYYQGLLELLIAHEDRTESQEFKADHEQLIETLKVNKEAKIGSTVSTQRTFRGTARTSVHVRDYVQMFRSCEICGGRYYPGLFTQVDHIVPHIQGGTTSVENGRNTHPFCNNNRVTVEQIAQGQTSILLPSFANPETLPKESQLDFFGFLNQVLSEDEEEEGEGEDE